MLLENPLVVWSILLTPLAYLLYNFVLFVLDVRKRGQAVEQFPGEPKHWLWGHLHLYPGPNEDGLEFGRQMTISYPRCVKSWIGPVIPTVILRHPETLKAILKSSGPNEAGLKYHREHTKLYPLAEKGWLGALHPLLSIRHHTTIKGIVHTSGPNDEGLRWEHGLTKKYSHYTNFCFGPLLANLWVWHPESIKKVLKSSEPKPSVMGIYGFGKPWIGDGLLISGGKKWARNRRLLTPAFHFDILKPYMKINNYCADLLLDKMSKAADNNESFEFYSNISLYTFDVILRCAMSYESDVQLKGESHPYIQSVTRLGDLWVSRVLTPWQHIDFLYKLSKDGREFKKHCDFVHTISKEVIQKRQKVLAETGSAPSKKCLDFLDILLTAKDEDGKGLTFNEIQDEVDTFLFEGHDTTASAIAWTVYSLAGHPEYQEKCQMEIDDILKGRETDEITWDDLPKLTYLTQCLKEAMRLHCPVPFISRMLTKDMTIDGKTLPKNSVIDIQIYNLHHNPMIWENNMVYDPSRFDPEKMEKMDSFAFVPFSAGPRNCIGQNFAMHEMKTILARIFRKFDVSLDPECKVEKKVGLVMKTFNGIRIKLIKRNH